MEKNLPTIDAAAADHVVLEHGEEEGEEMRALELICGEKKRKDSPLNKKKKKLYITDRNTFFFFFYEGGWGVGQHCSDIKPCERWALQV